MSTSNKDLLKRVLTSVPTNLRAHRVIKSSLAGGSIGAAMALLLSKKDSRLKNSLIWGGIGAATGAASSVLAHNIRTVMGGHYDKDPDYYDPKVLLSKLNKDKDTVTFYVSGASKSGKGKQSHKDSDKYSTDSNFFEYAFGDGDKLREAIESIPSNYKVNVVAHSAGGTVLDDLSKNMSRRIDNLKLLDTVDLKPAALLRRFFSVGYRKPSHVGKMEMIIPENYNNIDSSPYTDMDADKWVKDNILRMYPLVDDSIIRIAPKDNHSLLNTGLRLPDYKWNERPLDEKLAVLSNIISRANS